MMSPVRLAVIISLLFISRPVISVEPTTTVPILRAFSAPMLPYKSVTDSPDISYLVTASTKNSCSQHLGYLCHDSSSKCNAHSNGEPRPHKLEPSLPQGNAATTAVPGNSLTSSSPDLPALTLTVNDTSTVTLTTSSYTYNTTLTVTKVESTTSRVIPHVPPIPINKDKSGSTIGFSNWTPLPTHTHETSTTFVTSYIRLGIPDNAPSEQLHNYPQYHPGPGAHPANGRERARIHRDYVGTTAPSKRKEQDDGNDDNNFSQACHVYTYELTCLDRAGVARTDPWIRAECHMRRFRPGSDRRRPWLNLGWCLGYDYEHLGKNARGGLRRMKDGHFEKLCAGCTVENGVELVCQDCYGAVHVQRVGMVRKKYNSTEYELTVFSPTNTDKVVINDDGWMSCPGYWSVDGKGDPPRRSTPSWDKDNY
ncbi:hypothetical protein MKZ38_004778 [Zalerion maritima]|uniref:Uncharacterized protein n=1 Tax=Zalerion maritima TaxID=339359 RepID=A0AAD5WQR4_9PEZI|nr:hypothetical protein MKZ38_004778 [Zalerion maritima]